MPSDTSCSDPTTDKLVTTARCAVLAAAPGLVLTGIAAASSTSLTMRADLALTVLDMVSLVTVWALAERRHRSSCGANARAETLVGALVALCMTLSMATVATIALQRIMAGGVVPQGDGVYLGAALNVVYGGLNLWLLCRWRARRDESSALVRSQICLFSDKLSSNVLIAVAMGATLTLGESVPARFIDPVASLLIAVTTARWTIPVIRDVATALRGRRQRFSIAEGRTGKA